MEQQSKLYKGGKLNRNKESCLQEIVANGEFATSFRQSKAEKEPVMNVRRMNAFMNVTFIKILKFHEQKIFIGNQIEI